jgi:aminoglycoside phosphotransferase family enzyme/predicted kinase
MIPGHDMQRQHRLVAGLERLLAQTHGSVAVHETHLSWVFVAGDTAWKLKKAIRFDFADFSTLEKRRHFCHEEVRLNRRMAPDLYLGVEPLGGTPDDPVIGEETETPIEYAVRMKAFGQDCLWSSRLARGVLSAADIDGLAAHLARFHQETPIASANTAWGAPAGIAAVARDNITTIKALVPEAGRRLATAFAAWAESELERLEPLFAARRQAGFIRDCHGDLHAGNILTLDGRVEVFDCIDFNETLRWIDVVNDIAFITMDLCRHGRADFAMRLLNRYLEITGDYEGMQLLRFYTVQRAAVRCKVALLVASQQAADSPEAARAFAEARDCLEFCEAQFRSEPGRLVITLGFSGSGKSTFAQKLAECAGMIRLRSDLERKRLAGMAPTARDGAASGLYADGMTGMTYGRLETLARSLLGSGMNVVVDATFLDLRRREAFARLAAGMGVPFTILELQASDKTLRERVAARATAGSDPSDADLDILDRQLAHYLPLSAAERTHTVAVDAEKSFDGAAVKRVCDQIGLPTWSCAQQSSA